jgi:hypothetical protein
MDDQNADQKSHQHEDKLEEVKRRAMHTLTPLIADIQDMDPERKFDICLSAMRYTDNKDLADAALEAALAIDETGTKAEALVELINEINYLQQA